MDNYETEIDMEKLKEASVYLNTHTHTHTRIRMSAKCFEPAPQLSKLEEYHISKYLCL